MRGVLFKPFRPCLQVAQLHHEPCDDSKRAENRQANAPRPPLFELILIRVKLAKHAVAKSTTKNGVIDARLFLIGRRLPDNLECLLITSSIPWVLTTLSASYCHNEVVESRFENHQLRIVTNFSQSQVGEQKKEEGHPGL